MEMGRMVIYASWRHARMEAALPLVMAMLMAAAK
jgi:hypothetical protein